MDNYSNQNDNQNNNYNANTPNDNMMGQVNPGTNPYIMSSSNPLIDSPKKPSKTILIVAISVIIVMFGVIIALLLIPKSTPTPNSDFNYEEFNEAESDLRDHYDEMQSDPIFSITPYSDPNGKFEINAWFVDNDYFIAITPTCDGESFDEYINQAKNYLTTNLGTDLSKYIIKTTACPAS